MKEYLYKTKGFTYIELLIVVGIMLIFGAFLVASVNPVERIKAQRDSQRESDLNSILLSVQQKIKNDRGWDCPSEPLPQDKFTAIGTGPGEYDLYSCLLPNYLSKYLVDPKEGSSSGRDITDGLVGHWKFDEGTGTTAYDASGNGNDGTIVNSPTWVDGKMGEALDFNGSSNYVDAGNDESLNITDAITIEAWVKQKENNDGYVIMKNTANDSKRLYSIWSEGTANAIHFFYYSNGYQQITWNYTLDDNTWHHIVITVSGTTAKLYVDKVSQGDRTLAGAFQGDVNAKVKIGRREPNNYYFNGLIDDVRIYNRALSSEEIQDLYNYEYSSKYAVWQNPVTKNVSLKSIEDETKEVSTGAPELVLDFDGEGDYMHINDSNSMRTLNNWTRSIWVKPIGYGDVGYSDFWTQRHITNKFLLRWENSSASYGVYYYDSADGFSRISFNSLLGLWQFIVVVKDGSNISIYSNGNYLSGASNAKNFPDDSHSLVLGSNISGSGAYFNGLIGDTRIYNRALSAEEVEQLYKGYDIRNGLVGHWPLNEGTGTTAYDRSGNNNNGTLLPAGDGPIWTTK